MMKLTRLLLVPILCFSLSYIQGQECRNLEKYKKIVIAAQDSLAVGNYRTAQEYYKAAKIYCLDSSAVIAQYQEVLFQKMDSVRIKAEQNEKTSKELANKILSRGVMDQVDEYIQKKQQSDALLLALKMKEYGYLSDSLFREKMKYAIGKEKFAVRIERKKVLESGSKLKKAQIAPKGDYVAGYIEKNKLVLKNLVKDKELNFLKVKSFNFSNNGSKIALLLDGGIHTDSLTIYDLTRKKVKTVSACGKFEKVKFDSGSRILMVTNHKIEYYIEEVKEKSKKLLNVIDSEGNLIYSYIPGDFENRSSFKYSKKIKYEHVLDSISYPLSSNRILISSNVKSDFEKKIALFLKGPKQNEIIHEVIDLKSGSGQKRKLISFPGKMYFSPSGNLLIGCRNSGSALNGTPIIQYFDVNGNSLAEFRIEGESEVVDLITWDMNSYRYLPGKSFQSSHKDDLIITLHSQKILILNLDGKLLNQLNDTTGLLEVFEAFYKLKSEKLILSISEDRRKIRFWNLEGKFLSLIKIEKFAERIINFSIYQDTKNEEGLPLSLVNILSYNGYLSKWVILDLGQLQNLYIQTNKIQPLNEEDAKAYGLSKNYLDEQE